MKTWDTGAPACALALLAMQLAAVSVPALAQQAVYRCGQTYQQSPCPAEPARPLDLADHRTPAQQQDARAAAAAQSRQARALAAERKVRDKAVAPQTAPMGIAAPRPDQAASDAEGSTGTRRKKKSRKEDDKPRYWSGPPAKGR
jgi:hypothetical protein